MKRYILGFSKSKKDVGANIDESTRPLILHLIKLYLYPDSVNKNHWRKEVAEKLNCVSKLKGRNRYPSKEFILNYSWESYKNEIEYFVTYITSDYGYSEYAENIEEIKYFIFNYLDELSELLSEHGVVDYDKIYKLLSKYGF